MKLINVEIGQLKKVPKMASQVYDGLSARASIIECAFSFSQYELIETVYL